MDWTPLRTAAVNPDFDLHQLAHFLAVAKAGNLTRAAAALEISQPALSRSIHKLEGVVGEPLFERQPRGVKLTETGLRLRPRAQQICDLVDHTFSELGDARDRGQVRLAVIPTVAPYLLPGLLKSFARAHPEVQVHVQEDTTQNILRLCRDGDVDLALAALPIAEKHLAVEPLFEDELVLVVGRGHPLGAKKRVRLADIEGHTFISLDQQHCLSDNIAELCRRRSVAPVTLERTHQLATIQELVALGHGISIIPAMARRLDKSKQRVYRSFDGPTPTRTVALLQNPYRYERQAVACFKEHVRAVTAEASVR